MITCWSLRGLMCLIFSQEWINHYYHQPLPQHHGLYRSYKDGKTSPLRDFETNACRHNVEHIYQWCLHAARAEVSKKENDYSEREPVGNAGLALSGQAWPTQDGEAHRKELKLTRTEVNGMDRRKQASEQHCFASRSKCLNDWLELRWISLNRIELSNDLEGMMLDEWMNEWVSEWVSEGGREGGSEGVSSE